MKRLMVRLSSLANERQICLVQLYKNCRSMFLGVRQTCSEQLASWTRRGHMGRPMLLDASTHNYAEDIDKAHNKLCLLEPTRKKERLYSRGHGISKVTNQERLKGDEGTKDMRFPVQESLCYRSSPKSSCEC